MEILNVIVSRYSESREIESHSHNSYEFIYYYSANGNVECGKESFKIKNDYYFVIPPNIKHKETHKDKAHVFIMCFNLEDNISLNQTCSKKNSQYILSIVQKIKREYFSNLAFREKLLPGLLTELIVTIKRSNDDELHSKKADSAINFALSFINENYTNTISLKELSNSIGYCYDHFRILFKNHTNLTPKKYILEKKCALAKLLMNNDKLSLIEISEQCGFLDYPQFSKLFKSITNVSPHEYRKKQ